MSADCKFRPKSCFSSQQGHFADFFGDKAAPVVVHGAISLNFSESNKGEQILRKSRDRGERQVHLLIFHISLCLYTSSLQRTSKGESPMLTCRLLHLWPTGFGTWMGMKTSLSDFAPQASACAGTQRKL